MCVFENVCRNGVHLVGEVVGKDSRDMQAFSVVLRGLIDAGVSVCANVKMALRSSICLPSTKTGIAEKSSMGFALVKVWKKYMTPACGKVSPKTEIGMVPDVWRWRAVRRCGFVGF